MPMQSAAKPKAEESFAEKRRELRRGHPEHAHRTSRTFLGWGVDPSDPYSPEQLVGYGRQNSQKGRAGQASKNAPKRKPGLMGRIARSVAKSIAVKAAKKALFALALPGVALVQGLAALETLATGAVATVASTVSDALEPADPFGPEAGSKDPVKLMREDMAHERRVQRSLDRLRDVEPSPAPRPPEPQVLDEAFAPSPGTSNAPIPKVFG
ncbi:hypothetical protein CKO28_14165 [Rhodovibrio sodomensis]|uniref:Uncharacterized protein n=1 Tax=Rhodovibrio sodomensis TaxID=1088 RepID=A0ABS1DG07_9PROT|nr:hypothetical protein [Rhodovibrio sodomensis]MBK1669178.1 hypothetical protein [Rhodovibrio sodomensis]